MRLLYLITGLRLGGAEHQLLLIAEQMKAAHHVVLVVAMESDGVMVKSFENKGITVKGLHVKGVKSLFTAYHELQAIAKDFIPDIIHSHMIHANLMASVFKLFNRRCKLIATAHNILEGSNSLMLGYHFVNRVADWTTNVSQEAFAHFITQKYFQASHASFIPNAIDTDSFNPVKYNRQSIRGQLHIEPDKYVFFSAGRLQYQKNYQLLLRAFAALTSTFANGLLVIAGDGSERDNLEALAINLGIAHQTYFLGSRADVGALMSMSDCFVLSSHFEGFGLVVAEAMAMQLPVIATDCGGVKEVMGGFGRLIKPEHLNDLTAAMLLQTQSQNNNRVACRNHIERNYSVPSVISQWQQLYASV
jgi:glycosyltransferase involved in cell wall biosynthesis